MSPHGDLTVKLAETISPYWEDRGYKVFHDHGPSSENVGKIVSTLNNDYHHGDELSQLDIAIVEKDSNKIFVLVEIEETTDKPKTFLGDIFGVLFGEYIFFKRKELFFDDTTTCPFAENILTFPNYQPSECTHLQTNPAIPGCEFG